MSGGRLLEAMHGTRNESSVRYVVGALALLIVALVTMVASTAGVPSEDETVSAFGPIPEGLAAEPSPAPTATTPAELSPATDEVPAELANTETAFAPPTSRALVDEYYVPNFVAAGDRTGTGTAASAVTEAPTPTAAPQPTATPHTHPATPGPAPTPHTHDPTPGPAPTPHTHDPTPTPQPQPDPTATPGDSDGGSSDGPTAAQWEALRQCESGGNYSIISSSGLYHGAYQFNQGTWDSTASGVWPELVGVDPADAAPADQDKMAFRLYDLRSWQPWPVCGKHLI